MASVGPLIASVSCRMAACSIDSITRWECQESAKPAGCKLLLNGADILGSTASRSKLNSCKHPRSCFNLALVWVAILVFVSSDCGIRLKNKHVFAVPYSPPAKVTPCGKSTFCNRCFWSLENSSQSRAAFKMTCEGIHPWLIFLLLCLSALRYVSPAPLIPP